MKKILALLSLTVFLAVSVNAQSPQKSAPETKKEATSTSVKADAKAPGCCMKANSSCCKNNKEAKACTPEQKAACAKAGKECKGHDHAKAEDTKESKAGSK